MVGSMMTKAKPLLKRAELARTTGVRSSTIKYYTEIGILPFSQQGEGLARRYDKDRATHRLKEIRTLKGKGLCMDDIVKRLGK